MPFTIKTIENSNKHQGGNAMVYVLVALALFGFLTMTLSRSNNQADRQNISDEQAEFYTTELIEYVASAQNVIEMMLATGSEIDDLDFINPSSGGFDTPPHTHKLFHPQGGGLNYQEKFSEEIQNDAASVWVINENIDVEWTKLDTDGLTPLDDVILTAYFLTEQACEIINQKITGSTAIPVTANPHANYFLAAGNTDFDATECAGCDGYPSLCVENNTNDNYSFYNIIATKK